MKTPKLKFKLNNITSPMGAVVAFVVMIALLMLISKYKGRQVLRARRIMRKAYSGRPMTPDELKAFVESRKGMRGPVDIAPKGPAWSVHAARARRRIPSRALAGTRAWRRRWDQMSGSSRYSKGMTQGRKLGLHMHMA